MRTARARAVGVGVLVLALAVAGCGGNDADDTTATTAVVATAAAPAPAPPPAADAELAQSGRIALTDLGAGWRSDGPAGAPETSACPVAEVAGLTPEASVVSDRFLEDPPPSDALPMTLVQHVFLLPTLAQADAAFASQLSEAHLACLGGGLTKALQEVVADSGTVEASPWADLAWPATGDRAVGVGLNLTVRYPDGTTRPVTFATVVMQRGRGLSVLDVSWLRTEVPREPLVQALAAAADRLADARAAPDDRAL